jgi:hypothetical protein
VTETLYDQVGRYGVRSSVLVDEGGRPLIRHSQDTTAILEANKREAIDWQPTFQQNAIRARKVASIPFVVWQQLQARGIVKGVRIVDEPKFLAFLSDRDHRLLRTDNGGRLR